MGRLTDYVKQNSKWLKLEDGEEVVAEYLGYSFMMNPKGEEIPCYKFRLYDGETKSLQSQSAVLANFFDEEKGIGKVGNRVKLMRQGVDTNTRYKISLA